MQFMFPVYFLSLVMSAGLTLLSAYQILILSDLGCNLTDPKKCCEEFKKLILPEVVFVSVILLLNVASLNWVPVSTTSVMLAWLIYVHQSAPKGYMNLYDPSSASQQRVVRKHLRYSFFKVLFHLIHFVGFIQIAISTIRERL